MRNLINFILKNIHWLLFLLLVIVSVYLLVHNNEFQRSKYLAAVQELTGRMYSVSNNVRSYMNLKESNAVLLKRIAELETRVDSYERQVRNMQDSTGVLTYELDSTGVVVCRYTPAWIVNKRISGIENYIMLDKGSNDGIKPDMGVLPPDGHGIVGVVARVSSNFSQVIPLLNPKFRPNCKVKQSNHSGPLVWDGKDPQYAYLEELPRHITFSIGDTIVTSGYSSVFPAGIPVGTIVDSKKHRDDNFNALKIKLLVDFSTLNDVLIVQNSNREEQLQLEKEAARNDKK